MNRAVGAFILVTVAIAGVVIFEAAQVREWFNPGDRLRVLLPPEGSFGLETGAEVKMLGTGAGRVLDIRIDEQGRMTAQIEVRADFARFVRTDSFAMIRKRFGVAGDAFLELSRGTGNPLDPTSGTIQARADQAPTETLQILVDELRGSVVPAVAEARAGIKAWTEFAIKLQDPDGEFLHTVRSVSAIAARVERGEGTVGRLLADEELATRLLEIVTRTDELLERAGPLVSDLERTMANAAETSGILRAEAAEIPGTALQLRNTLATLQNVLGEVEQTARELPALARDVRDTSAVLPMLVLQAQQTLHKLERLLEGLQNHWLFRDSMPPLDAVEPIRPREALP